MKKAFEVGFTIALAAAGVTLGRRLVNGNWPTGGSPAIARAETTQATGVGYKTLTVMAGDLMSPLYITRVTVGKRPMLLGIPMSAKQQRSHPNLIHNTRPFQAGNDWLKDMTIYVKNRTDKTVAWLSLSLRFPETGNGRTEPVWIYHVQLGRLPAVDVASIRTKDGKPLRIGSNAKPLDLQPGQEIVVHVGDYIDKIKAYVETAMPLFYVTKCDVSADDCAFDDGMRWAGGAFSVPDPAHPGKWMYFPSGYFPGNPRQYWPPGL